MATNTCGRDSRAASTRRRSIANERGTTRIASVRPVTDSPPKSPMRCPPAELRRWPPKPKISASGWRAYNSAVSAAAYRSPDASPRRLCRQRRGHEIELFDGDDLEVGEAHRAQLRDEALRDADQHDRQTVG